MTVLRISQVDAAAHQLSWAIRLLIEFNEPIPAITLAGAAEEVLGTKIEVRPAAHLQIKSSLAERGIADAESIGKFMNELRNFLKHHRDFSLRMEDRDLQAEAITMVTRAATNYGRSGNHPLPEHYAFLKWAKTERPDLFIRAG